MRKLATYFLLMITFSLLFTGIVSAVDPSVQIGILGDVTPGNTVGVDVAAEANDEQVVNPMVTIKINPETSLDLDEQNALMSINSVNWVVNSDPVSGGFLTWDAVNEVWLWHIGQFGNLDPGDYAEIVIPALVKQAGPITVSADLLGFNSQSRQYELFDSATNTYNSGNSRQGRHPPCAGTNVPMQDTGAPLVMAALAILSIIGGAVYGKLR
ncbi:MAG: hypothetical protein LLF83_09490 [Methanobacterium sp.]|nr:hypothetical protein [Methanobacterium sp.]